MVDTYEPNKLTEKLNFARRIYTPKAILYETVYLHTVSTMFQGQMNPHECMALLKAVNLATSCNNGIDYRLLIPADTLEEQVTRCQIDTQDTEEIEFTVQILKGLNIYDDDGDLIPSYRMSTARFIALLRANSVTREQLSVIFATDLNKIDIIIEYLELIGLIRFDRSDEIGPEQYVSFWKVERPQISLEQQLQAIMYRYQQITNPHALPDYLPAIKKIRSRSRAIHERFLLQSMLYDKNFKLFRHLQQLVLEIDFEKDI